MNNCFKEQMRVVTKEAGKTSAAFIIVQSQQNSLPVTYLFHYLRIARPFLSTPSSTTARMGPSSSSHPSHLAPMTKPKVLFANPKTPEFAPFITSHACCNTRLEGRQRNDFVITKGGGRAQHGPLSTGVTSARLNKRGKRYSSGRD